MMLATSSRVKSVSTQLKEAIDIRTKELLDQLENKENQLFTFDETLLKSCQNFGLFYNKELVCPSKCHVTGEISSSTVDEASYVTVHLFSDIGSQCHNVDSVVVDVNLVHINTEIICKGEKIKNNGNTITFRYVPLEQGDHRLEVTVFDQPVRGSPFNLLINMPFKLKCIVKSTLSDSFYRPGGLAIGENGELAVVDTKGWSTVHVYNSNHQLVMSTGAWGSGEGQCWNPIGVTFDLSGNLLVVDGDNHRIHKFDRQGKHIMSVGEKGRGKMEFLRPTGICVSRAGYVYICDRGNHRVQILKPNLTYDSMFGGYGEGPSHLHYPWDVAVDSEGFVYVTVPGHHCLKKFTPNGEMLQMIGPRTTGIKKDEPQCLAMLCIDKYDYIYVTDHEANCVFVFDANGRYHTKFGCYGYSEGQFYEPRGIAKGSGSLYVSEVRNRRIQKFE